MLFVIHGKDTTKGREKLHTLIAALQKKRPGAAFLRYDDETIEVSALDELIHGQGLFSPKSIITLDRVLENEEVKDMVLARVKDIAASENAFAVFEGALNKKTLAKLEKHAEKVQAAEAKEETDERFNIFSLTDALGRRDRKRLWVMYQKARMRGVSDEEIHGMLFWQIKAMLLAAGAKSAKDAGLNPFVYKKSLGFLDRYSPEELCERSKQLVTLYHEARRGRHELGTALERFILAV